MVIGIAWIYIYSMIRTELWVESPSMRLYAVSAYMKFSFNKQPLY